MNMTHNEALVEAEKVFWLPVLRTEPYTSIDAAIRAYIEARGLGLVPKEPTDSQKDAASAVGPDTPYGLFGWDNAEEIYAAMLAAAPDPFGDE